jgi:hypothetical protein
MFSYPPYQISILLMVVISLLLLVGIVEVRKCASGKVGGNRQGGVAGLPPAPTWETLHQYAQEDLNLIIAHFRDRNSEMPLYWAHPTSPAVQQVYEIEEARISGDEEFVTNFIYTTVEEAYKMYATVATRGQTYGENVLLAMGEEGMIMMITTKIMRLMWSQTSSNPMADRKDSYVDIAGYCLLALALDSYAKEYNKKESANEKL